MKTPIDLGRKSDFNEPLSTSTMKDEAPVHYPEFHYSGDKELDLPDEGVMEIRFRISHESEDKKNGRYSCTVEVLSIEEVEGDDEVESPTKSGNDTEVALDDLAKKLISLHNVLEKTD